MEEFDKELAQYGILAKNAQKLIEKERVCVFGNAEIETIDIKILQEKDIKCLDIKSKKIKNIIFVKDISLDMFFSGVTFTNEIKTDSKFTGELDFSGCTFKEEVNFEQANFKNFLCAHTTFEKQVSFLSAVFGNTENKKEISFSNVTFLNSAIFTNAIFNSDMDFYKVFFQKRLSFSRAKFNCNKAKFNIECKDEAWFIGVAGKNITIIESNFENNLTLGVTFDLLNIIDSEILKDLTLNISTGNNIGIINSTIEKNTDLSFLSANNISLNNSTFKGEISLSINNFTLTQNINFKDITFGKLYIPKELFVKSVNFERCIFLQDMNFKDYTFNEVAFNTCTFKESAYFNNSNFTKGVDFHECEFEKTACFYGVKFDETPNFSQALFKSNINVINSNLNFGFTRVDKKIQLMSLQGKGKYNYEIANDFRDSFRNFKSALIKDNNLLDASKFHKYELYCKEIELEEKKPKIFSKEWIDKWQLVFYRKLCDHHTDLLKVFHNLLIIIMLFSVFSFVLDKFKQPSIENNAKYHIVQVDTNESYIFKEHNKTTYNFLSLNIEQEFKNLDNLLSKTEIYFSLGFVLLVTFVALLNKKYLWLLLLPFFVGVVYCIGFPISIITHFMIIVLFACTFVFIMVFDSKPERFLFVGVSYIVCIFTLLAKPSLMLPVFGSFLEKDTNATYPLLLSLSVVYFILVALVIFSLQKTARKNSIVPS
ncbi:pentapeptide repeat-containing protein [Campylobacter lari]|nr:pentapeptide repeat-containing protein [Campylobacter lari]MCV3421698.1 pentapeptide repeat-containing protein [Campylobacter lari]HEC1753777.1 pentapeptide repeat-containing protein [Campylobacter lari]